MLFILCNVILCIEQLHLSLILKIDIKRYIGFEILLLNIYSAIDIARISCKIDAAAKFRS